MSFFSLYFKVKLSRRAHSVSCVNITERTQVFLQSGIRVSHIYLSAIKKKKKTKQGKFIKFWIFTGGKKTFQQESNQIKLVAGRARPWKMKWFAWCLWRDCNAEPGGEQHPSLPHILKTTFISHKMIHVSPTAVSNAKRFLSVICDSPRSAKCRDNQAL